MGVDSRRDEQLMEAIADGGMAELGELVRRHQDKVVALAYRTLGDWGQAEDVGQEAFLRVYRAAGRYRADAKFTTWLYRIVVNLCLDEKRRSVRLPVTGVEIPEQESRKASDNPAKVMEKQERVKLVWAGLSKLNKRQRMAVVLHRFDGLSHEQVAEVTGWSKSAVESLLVRAYGKLRKELVAMKESTK